MNSNTESINQSKVFFDNFTKTLRTVFKDKALTLEFVQKKFEFFLNLSDGRKVTFNQLSEGFSAFLSILVDLVMRIDLIRKQKHNFNYDPPGIVLIDEPETHLHIEMQYEILPALATLFPKIQFIIATHSPAIISSLDDAVVYDLSSKSIVSDWIQGSSYSELMIKHFGLENEFAPKADELLGKLNQAILETDEESLNRLLIDYEKILTPSLKLEIESRIIEVQSLTMINISREAESPSSLETPEIQAYIQSCEEYKNDPENTPKPTRSVSYRNSDLLEAFDRCFYSKCYLTEEKFFNSWKMDVEHFVPQSENPSLVYEWSNLYPAEHKANMCKPRITPQGGYLDPCSDGDDVETEIFYSLTSLGESPNFEARDSANQKAINTANLLGKMKV